MKNNQFTNDAFQIMFQHLPLIQGVVVDEPCWVCFEKRGTAADGTCGRDACEAEAEAYLEWQAAQEELDEGYGTDWHPNFFKNDLF